MNEDIFRSQLHSRLEVEPSCDCGVYGLFLLPGSNLGWLEPGREGLIYVGKAEGSGGFAQRCHFAGHTINHSPRKSLAMLLRNLLSLELRGHPDNKWGLSPQSDRRLSDWMFANLRVAYLPTAAPAEAEKRLVLALATPLNLNICEQGLQQRRISQMRREAKAEAHAGGVIQSTRRAARMVQSSVSSVSRPMARIEGAPAIADYFGLDRKQYRAALRNRKFAWHQHWGSWSVPYGSKEWQEMIVVAEQISGRRWEGVA